jgi:Tol biopolymer transport system component
MLPWSPDGQKIVYVNGQSVFIANGDGTESRRLFTLPGFPFWLRWSPDANRFRLTVSDAKTNTDSLWEAAADGSNPHPLLPGWGNSACCGTWTMDGRYFVFESYRGSSGRSLWNQSSDIWTLRERSRSSQKEIHQLEHLTAGPTSYTRPVSSPDGKKLYAYGGQFRGELASYDVRSKQFVPYLGGISAEFLDFSRDGKWVTYVAFPEKTLWRSKMDGSERLQLTLSPLRVFMPRWSPDGKRIAFFAIAPGRPYEIYAVPAEGVASQKLVSEGHTAIDPSWSPNGKQLAFSSAWWVEPESATMGIRMLDSTSRQISTLPGSERLCCPRWSPDGRYVDAVSVTSQLMLFDFTTHKWQELTNFPVSHHSWSLDGQYLYFESNYVEDPAIFRIRMRDRKVERVTNLRDVRRTGYIDEYWSGVAPDNSPLVLRDVGFLEIYALEWEAP